MWNRAGLKAIFCAWSVLCIFTSSGEVYEAQGRKLDIPTPNGFMLASRKLQDVHDQGRKLNGATNARRFVLFVRKGSVDPTGIQGDTLSISLTDISDAEIDEAAFKEMKSEFRNHYHPMFEFC